MPEAQLALVSMRVALEAEQNLEFMPMTQRNKSKLSCETSEMPDLGLGIMGGRN